jgi:uncharacterized protein (DUF305 family)
MKGMRQLCVIVLLVGAGSVAALQHGAHPQPQAAAPAEPAWSDLQAGMEKMHGSMASVKTSGNSDVDFVRLMLPHHQAALDMAKTELLYGKDPQMRRLAQEIITDQQSEIDLMQLWLKQHSAALPPQQNAPAGASNQ